MSDPIICPTCGGNEVDCLTCGLPPKRSKPFDRRVARADLLNVAFVVRQPAAEYQWAVQGIDISSWNGTMNFAITRTKAQFAFVRLGYGSRFKDNKADINRSGLLAAGMPYGGYWYCRPGIDSPVETAESFAQCLAEFDYQLDICIDAEQTHLDDAGTHSWLVILDQRLMELTRRGLQGFRNMPYSSAGFWDAHLPETTYWGLHPKFVANWTDGNAPYLPHTWRNWLFWQWSADGNRLGREYGSGADGDADMDLDRYYGTVDQFNERYGTHILPLGEIPPEEPPEEPQIFDPQAAAKITVITNNLRLRAAPSLQGKILCLLPSGFVMATVGKTGDWQAVVSYVHSDHIKEL